MYAGRKVEEAAVGPLFRTAAPSLHTGPARLAAKLGSSLIGQETRLAEIPGLVPSLKAKIPAASSPHAART
jgi:peptide/nickel transport system ATP-binding protein